MHQNPDLNKILFRDNATLITTDIGAVSHDLYSEEEASLAEASVKRIQEFRAGRYCATQALHSMGIENFPILRGKNREPIWPDNIVGSISHCKDIAGAVVADKHRIKSVGLDIENQKQLKLGFAKHVCTDSERIWLESQNADFQNQALLLIFSIKEAVFKCIYQSSGVHLTFRECNTAMQYATGEANVEITKKGLKLRPGEVEARFYTNDDHIFSAAMWHYLPAVG